MPDRVFGEIPGFPVGSQFPSRKALSNAGVHRPTQAGISGAGNEGADSIVLSGGYEDDQDFGDVIIYTGQGGRDLNSGRQIEHQQLTRGNQALARSRTLGLPVRVIRGANHNSQYSPEEGYRYDGLYIVEDYWRELGQAGYYVWRYRLVEIEKQSSSSRLREEEVDYSTETPQRREVTTQRIIRDTKQSRWIKQLYEYRCQICGIRLEGPTGFYAEAAHIKPLGQPHNGPDSPDNILCLCPNHHVLFDIHGFTITDDLELIGIEGQLHFHPGHKINLEYVQYHREHYSDS